MSASEMWSRPIVIYSGFNDSEPKNPGFVDEQLVEFLTNFPDPACDVATCIGKNCHVKFASTSWSSATYPDGAPRGNGNVIGINYAVFDLDHLGDGKLEDIRAELEEYEYVIHSTHSHVPSDGCYRIVFPLSRPALAHEYKRAHAAIVHVLNLPSDPSCKDISRLFAAPTARVGVEPFADRHQGKVLDVDEALEVARLLGQVAEASSTAAVVAPTLTAAPGGEPIDLGALRDRLATARRSKAHGDVNQREQAALLGRMLDGQPLAEVGERHHARIRLCGLIAHWLPASTPWEPVLELLRPTLMATPLADGEALEGAIEKTRELYVDSMVRRLSLDAKRAEQDASLRALLDRARSKSATSAAVGDVEPDAPPQPLRNGSFESLLRVVRENIGDVLDGRLLEYDAMADAITLGRQPLLDHEVSKIRSIIETRVIIGHDKKDRPLGLRCSEADLGKAFAVVAHEREFHPVQDYLSELAWDKEPRIDKAVDQVFRAEATPIACAIFRRWFISAVARAFQPGAKVDTMLVLISARQGTKKSTAFEVLAGAGWFDDTPIDVRGKDGLLKLRGKWIIEWSELESIRLADSSAVKAFLSSHIDKYRPPYGRNEVSIPRTCVIVGTTNHAEFLVDETGNRRFWPVVVGEIDVRRLAEWRDQLWAEAVVAYLAGEQWWLTDDERVLLEDVHVGHHVGDVWEDDVLKWMDRPVARTLGLGGTVNVVELPRTTKNILQHALGFAVCDYKPANAQRVGKILRGAEWELRRPDNEQPRVWMRARSAGGGLLRVTP